MAYFLGHPVDLKKISRTPVYRDGEGKGMGWEGRVPNSKGRGGRESTGGSRGMRGAKEEGQRRGILHSCSKV